MIHILSETRSILNQYISEIRDAAVQKDSMRFRENLERIGEIFAYEISKEMDYTPKEVVTPLGIATVPSLNQYPVLATILRAGLPFHKGFLNIFDRSESVFVSAYRKPHKDGTFTMNIESASVTDMDGKVLILLDTMVATGSSMVYTFREIQNKARPSHVHFVTILASMEGLNFLKLHMPKKNADLWVGVVDEELTVQSFIVPGLGDAGDLAYGKKI
jgi:uracil phosphoribosyltransferase